MFQLNPVHVSTCLANGAMGLFGTLGLTPKKVIKFTIITIFLWMVYVAQIHVVRYA